EILEVEVLKILGRRLVQLRPGGLFLFLHGAQDDACRGVAFGGTTASAHPEGQRPPDPNVARGVDRPGSQRVGAAPERMLEPQRPARAAARRRERRRAATPGRSEAAVRLKKAAAAAAGGPGDRDLDRPNSPP